MDTKALTARGRQTLSLPDIEWQQAQSPHFVVHYTHAIFARKIARMAEFFYSYIRQDFPEWADRVPGRSHIIIFRNPTAWQRMTDSWGDVQEWTFSMVEGPVMYLQQADSLSASGDVLAHEMTHLVFNRILPGHCPLWLNEGLAEYYGAFAYSAFKGIKKSRRAQFRRLARIYPLDRLFADTHYPFDPKDVRAYYDTAKYAVGFLLLDNDPGVFPSFVTDLTEGTDIRQALAARYSFQSPDEFEKAFLKFAR